MSKKKAITIRNNKKMPEYLVETLKNTVSLINFWHHYCNTSMCLISLIQLIFFETFNSMRCFVFLSVATVNVTH